MNRPSIGAETEEQRATRVAAIDATIADHAAARDAVRAETQPAVDAAKSALDAARAAVVTFDTQPERQRLVGDWRAAHEAWMKARVRQIDALHHR